MEKANFAAGCFWHVEEAFKDVPGVHGTAVGYQGGTRPEPSYENVCSGATGHAETLEVDFDPEEISYEQLLDRFWDIHDPTTRDRQGPDVGTQYRSAIFVRGPEQEREAQASLRRAQERLKRPIVTEIVPATDFWRAEDYHQRYLETRGGRGKGLASLLGLG